MFSLLQHKALRMHVSQLWRFIVCGGMGSVLDLGSLYVFVQYAQIDDRLAVILSSCVGAAFVFVANKFFTFRNREKSYGNQAIKFALVYGVSIIANALIANLLLWLGLYYILAKLGAIAIGAVWNYALSHGFVFKNIKDEEVVVA